MKDKLDLILDNQRIMMRALRGLTIDSELMARENVILTQLNPTEEPSLTEQTDKSMNRVIKAGQDCPRCGVIGVCDERLEYHNSGRCIPKTKKVKVEKWNLIMRYTLEREET